jgi:hypothetical protein
VLLLVAAGLFGLIPGCGDDDSSGPAPPPPEYTGKEAAEASLDVAFSTLELLSGIFDGLPSLGGLGAKTAPVRHPSLSILSVLEAAAAAKDRALTVAGGGPIPCEGGGTRDVSCTASATSSNLSGVFSNCVADTSGGYTTTINGSVTVDVQDPLACGYKGFPLPDSVAVTIAFDNFSLVTTDSLDVIVDSFTADITISLAPTGPGCEGADGTISINGTMDSFSLLEDRNISVAADNLTMERATIEDASGTGPDTCTTILIVDGGAVLSNAEHSFSLSFVEFRYTITDLDPYFRVTVDGSASTTCTNTLFYDTVLPILTTFDNNCPYAGAMRVLLSDNTLAQFVFTPSGGVTMDYPWDNEIDEFYDSCDDALLAKCHNPS